MKIILSDKYNSPYPIYLSYQPDRSEPINTTSQPDYAITDHNLSTYLHQADFTNQFQTKLTPS